MVNGRALKESAIQFFREEIKRHEDVTPPISQNGPGLHEIVSLIPENFSGRVLDAAAGTGTVAFLIARNFPDSKVVGIDICQGAIEIATENNSFSNASFLSADYEYLPFISGSFDFIVNRFSFHHSPSPEEALKEFKRSLKPGGYLIIIDPTPTSGKLNKRLNEIFIEAERELSGHVKFYSVEDYEELADKSEFEFSCYKKFSHEIGLLDSHVKKLEGLSDRFLEKIRFEKEKKKINLDISVLIFRKRKKIDELRIKKN